MSHPPTQQSALRVLRLIALGVSLLTVFFTSRPVWAVAEDFESFTGSGLAPTPAAGQLDSDSWSIEGLSDGDIAFGDTAVSGDAARGASSGGVGAGGIYAFDTGANVVLGFQATGTDLTPGSIIHKVRNDTGNIVTAVEIDFDLWVLNDQGRSTIITFSYAEECSSYSAVPSLSTVTPEAAAATPAWTQSAFAETISGLTIAPGAAFCLRWDVDDGSGSGSRDEIGLDNVLVTPATPTLVELAAFSAERQEGATHLHWETSVELDNAGFNLLRAERVHGRYTQINATLLASSAAPGHGASYGYVDPDAVDASVSALFYLLEDVNQQGIATRHGPIRIDLSHENGVHLIYIPGLMQ